MQTMGRYAIALSLLVFAGCSNSDNNTTNNTTSNNTTSNNTTQNTNGTNNGTSNNTTSTSNNMTPGLTEEDCEPDQVFIEEYCTKCAPDDSCEASEPACLTICEDGVTPCASGTCLNGACREVVCG